MKRAIIVASLAALLSAPLLSSAQAQTACGENCGLPGGHPHSDYFKVGNGDHGNDGGNGG